MAFSPPTNSRASFSAAAARATSPPGRRASETASLNTSVSSPPSRSPIPFASSTNNRTPPAKEPGSAGRLKDLTGGVVKSRKGSVLTRGAILKSDHYASGRARSLDINLQGAPNFRQPRSVTLGVYGVAQPTTIGLRTILALLDCQPGREEDESGECVWISTRDEPLVYISGRSYVLRHAASPKKSVALSDRAASLEGIEERMKADILKEARKYGGLMLTHEEMADGEIVPTWLSVDAQSVLTPREVWEVAKAEGFKVEYHRIPISRETPIEDNYLDAYVKVMKTLDPVRTSLVFSCGMGVVRTTFAMVSGLLIRRKQLLLMGEPDPFDFAPPPTPQGNSTLAASVMEQANAQQQTNKSLLRLTHLVEKVLSSENQQSAIEILISHQTLLENLRAASLGQYHIVLNLLACLENGPECKRLVDTLIDNCSQIVNLREAVLDHRLRSSTTRVDEDTRQSHLREALKALERYAFAVAFAGYLDESADLEVTFAEFLQQRTEIRNMIEFLRRKGSRLFNFAPISDLSVISKRAGGASKPATDVSLAGGQVYADEYAELVVHNRNGILLRSSTLLKSDIWRRSDVNTTLAGAVNFRRVPHTNIYALGQPDVGAIDQVISIIREQHPDVHKKITWINLREEPIVYVNQEPYCLRKEGYSLRNLKDFGGISATRLEVLEERLKGDVLAELTRLDGKLLLHTETVDGDVVPVWEDAAPDDVAAIRDIMDERSDDIDFKRIPITSEAVADFTDINDLLEVVIRADIDCPIVLNCQLGRGRSTLASVLMLLIQNWIAKSRREPTAAPTGAEDESAPMSSSVVLLPTPRKPFTRGPSSARLIKPRRSYQVINNLLRVIRRGLEVKQAVDDAIEAAGEIHNLRDAIEESRVRAEAEKDPNAKRSFIQKGLNALRRYFSLIVFQAYLQDTPPDTIDTLPSFKDFVEFRPVLRTFEKEIKNAGLEALTPLERDTAPEGNALSDEVDRVVKNRAGRILSASTLLKSDFFSGLQKMSLPERIPGAANFRRIPLAVARRLQELDIPRAPAVGLQDEGLVVGVGMPSGEGLRGALAAMGAGQDGSSTVFWTSLREEPVIYIVGQPHVLRLANKPLTNVESTGVATDVVEAMEDTLKRDIIEAARDTGRILLHDEQEISPGNFKIIPIWQNVEDKDVLTPREVFEEVQREGYKVDYARVAITDEQAPLPNALAQIQGRAVTALESEGSLAFNCQMGRGRTTTGMIVGCLVAAVWGKDGSSDALAASLSYLEPLVNQPVGDGDNEEDENPYLQGQYRMILQLVGVLSHGKRAKALADKAIDVMEGVQNLRNAVYTFKLQAEAAELGSAKHKRIFNLAFNYLHRYGMLVTFANFLLEAVEHDPYLKAVSFPEWLVEHREVTSILSRRTLD